MFIKKRVGIMKRCAFNKMEIIERSHVGVGFSIIAPYYQNHITIILNGNCPAIDQAPIMVF